MIQYKLHYEQKLQVEVLENHIQAFEQSKKT